jgi:membrane peptidoglycan carboxypeptidase
VISRIVDGQGNVIPSKVRTTQVLTAQQDSDVDYALSKDTVPGGTATKAAMDDGREIIGKTGTTEEGQAAWFVGAIPQYSTAVGMFTDTQSQSLNGVGGLPGYGGEWPAQIWHTFAELEFANLPPQNFPPPHYGGTVLDLANTPLPTPNSGTPPNPGAPNHVPGLGCDPTVDPLCHQHGGGNGCGPAPLPVLPPTPGPQPQPTASATPPGRGGGGGGLAGAAAIYVTPLYAMRRRRQ